MISILDHGEQQNTEGREQSYTSAYNVALIMTAKRLSWSEQYLISALLEGARVICVLQAGRSTNLPSQGEGLSGLSISQDSEVCA